MTARTLIVDDHTLFAEAIRPTLEGLGLIVIGVASSGREAMQAVRDQRPDLVLVDLGLPDQSGLVVGRMILEERPGTKVLALTALEDPHAVKEAIRAGFHGYLTKDTSVSQFADAITAALGGQVVVPHRLAPRATGARTPEEQNAAFLAEQLTRREREVLALLVEGASGHAIAERLRISPNTVRTHIQSILTKLQVHSRLEAVTFAVRHGIVEAPRARR